MDTRPKTILCDIDGTLVYHEIPACNTSPMDNLMELPGTVKNYLNGMLKDITLF